MTTIKTKKTYAKPSMEVYELKNHPQLLQNSLPTNPTWPGGEPWQRDRRVRDMSLLLPLLFTN